MDPLDAVKQTYFQECEELLPAMEEGLLAMEEGDADGETINAVFRAVHSIKGGGGAFGFQSLVDFAHVFETVLDLIRSDQLEVTPEAVAVLLRAGDILADHVAAARSGEARDAESDADVRAELDLLAGGSGEAAGDDGMLGDDEFAAFGFAQIAIDEDEAESAAPADASEGWRIRFKPRPGLYATANEPQLIIRELMTLGDLNVALDHSALPDSFAETAADGAYFAWDITLKGEVERTQIAEAFDWVIDECELTIDPLGGDASEDALPNAITEEAVEPDVDAAIATIEQVAAITPEFVAPEVAPDIAKVTAPAAETVKKVERPAAAPTIRVDPEKVDRLVNLVGELVITQAMLSQRVQEDGLHATSPVVLGLEELEHLLRELQEGVMAVRTQPVKSVFQRMHRLVREVASQTGKQVRLQLEGESTEVDKTVIERLAEPLTHMIRNAVDHGLETPEERIAAGKPEEGTVRLSAEHRGGRILIQIRDDGRGINRAKVLEKAIEKGLIAQDAQLSNEEIDNLIFMPGFSTASQVSDISGRGVGMDVVRRNITELGGRVSIESDPGKGSRFSMTLPLTLAVLDGMVISVGDQTFVVPLSNVVESLQPEAGNVRNFGRRQKLLKIRSEHVPIVHISELLGVKGAQTDPSSAVVMLVESEGAGKLALVVDDILGQRQVVIKSFETNYRRIDGVSAATILGDGRVALILDIDGLVSVFRQTARDDQSAPLVKGASA